MLRLFRQITFRVFVIIGLSVVLCNGLSRAAQKSLPSLYFSRDLILYRMPLGCASLLDACATTGQQLTTGLYSIPVALWSPDGKTLAVHLRDSWAIYPASCLPDLTACKATHLDPTINDARITWGPDGSLIAYLDSTDTLLTIITRGCWDGSPPAKCVQRSIPVTDPPVVGQESWSADGQAMVFVNRMSSGFVLLDLSCLDDPAGCDRALKPLGSPNVPVAWPSLSPDGKMLLYHADTSGQDYHQALFMMNIETGETQPITFRDGSSFYPDWTRDEHYIVYSGYATPRSLELNLYVVDWTRGITATVLHRPRQNFALPVWGTADQ